MEKVLNSAYQFYQEYEIKNQQRATPLNIANLLIVMRGDKYEIVDETSIEGCYLSFKSWFLHIFDIDSEIEENLKTIQDIFKNVVDLDPEILAICLEKGADDPATENVDFSKFSHFAFNFLKTFNLSPPIQPNLNKKNIEIYSDQSEKKLPPPPLPDFFLDLEKQKNLTKVGLSNLLPNFTENEIDVMTSFVLACPNKLHLFKVLFQGSRNRQEACSSLQWALFNTIISTEETEETEIYKKAIDCLERKIKKPLIQDSHRLKDRLEVTNEKNPSNNLVTLKNIAAVLGDTFISETEMEGEYVGVPYAYLAADFLEQRYEPSDQTNSLIQVLRQSIALCDTQDVQTLLQTIEKNLTSFPNGPQRCLIFGGWSRHAIVYEIERHRDTGLFSFRVFNLGDGAEYHDTFLSNYKLKVRPCIAIKDIPANNLLNRSFISGLQLLFKCESEPVKKLHAILSTLNGVEEPVSEHVQRYVATHRAGICIYKSLQAFFANTFEAPENKHFNFEFKLFLLEKFLPELQKTLLNPISKKQISFSYSDPDKEYYELYLAYGVIKRSIETFAKGVAKLEKTGSFSEHERKIKRAQEKIIEYETTLKKMKEALLTYEKTYQTQEIEHLSAIQCQLPVSTDQMENPLNVRNSNLEALEVDSRIEKMHLFIEKVEKMPDSLESHYTIYVESLLEELSSFSIDQLFEATEILFKKIGRIEEIKKLEFNHPEKIFLMTKNICERLSFQTEATRFEISLSIFVSFYIAECAFRQLPLKDRVLNEQFPSFFNCINLSRYEYATCHDPFWVTCYEDLLQLQGKIDKDRIPSFSSSEGDWEFDPQTTQDILNWFESEHPDAMESIQNDRKIQKQIVEAFILKKKQEIETLRTQMESPECSENGERQRELQSEIFTINQKIDSIEKQTHDDYHYWPWGWEDGVFKDEKKAVFLFANNRESFLQKKLNIAYPILKNLKEFYYLIFTVNDSFFTQNTVFNKNAFAKKNRLELIHNYYLEMCDAWGKNEFFSWQRVFYLNTPNLKGLTKYNLYFQHFDVDDFLSNSDWYTFLRGITVWAIEPGEKNIPYRVNEQNKRIKKNPLLQQEITELLSIRQSNIQIDSTLNYFRRNSHKLQDLTGFLIFHSFLFESNYLVEKLSDPLQNQSLFNRLELFFEEMITYAHEIENYHLLGNLFWTLSTVQDYIDFSSSQLEKKGEKPLPSLFSHNSMLPYLKMVLLPKYEEQWPVFFESFLAACKNFKFTADSDSKKMMNYIIVVNLFRNQYPVKEPHIFQVRKREAEQTVKKFVFDCFSKKDPLLTSKEIAIFINQENLLNIPFPTVSTQFTPIENHPEILLSIDKQFEINLSYGFIRSTIAGPLVFNQVPTQEQKEHLLQFELIPAKDTLSLSSCQCEDRNYIINTNTNPPREFIYHCKSKQTSHSKVQLPLIYVKIHTPDGPKFAEFLHKPTTPIDVGMFNQLYHHFIVDGTIYLCDPITFEPIYHATTQEKKWIIRQLAPPHLIVFKPLDTFEHFEHLSGVHYLGNEKGKLKIIDFVRLGISFKVQNRNGEKKWVNEQDKKWFLSSEQFAPNLGFTGYLVLENDKGQKKVLIPVWNPKSMQKRALNFHCEYQFDTGKKTGVFLEYHFNSDESQLIPQSLEARLYLARIYLEKGLEDLAENLLSHYQAKSLHQAYSPKEVAHLENLIFYSASKISSSRAIYLRLYALSLLKYNEAAFPETIERQEVTLEGKQDPLKISLQLFTSYLSRLGHTPSLGKEHELRIIKYIRSLISPSSKVTLEEKQLLDTRYAELKGSGHLAIEGKQTKPARPNFQLLLESGLSKESENESEKKGHAIPKLKNMIEYRNSRLKHEFPFDYTNPKMDESTFLNEYFPLIQQECQRSKHNPIILDNGLLALLYYLACFGNTALIQKTVKKLIIELQYTPPKKQPAIHPAFSPQKSREMIIRKGINSLHHLPLTPASSDDLTYLPALGKEYFEYEEISSTVKEPLDLFEETHLEVSKDNKSLFEAEKKEMDNGYSHLVIKNYAIKNGKSLVDLREDMHQKQREETKILAKQETLLSQAISTLLSDPNSHFSFSSKMRPFPSISELCMLCGSEDALSKIQELYPEFSYEGIKKLMVVIKHYLIQKQFVQHISRCIAKIDDYLLAEGEKASLETLQAMLNDIGAHMAVTRYYDVNQDKLALMYLALETTQNIKLHPFQLEHIARIQKNNVAAQLTMGSGKTHVIQPLIACLSAKKGKISTVCVPKALYHPIVKKLSETLGSAFKQFLFAMPLNRNLAKNYTYLKNYLKRLQDAKKHGTCILQSIEEKHPLFSGLIEAYYEASQTSITKKEQNRIEKIRGKQPEDEQKPIVIEKNSKERHIDILVEICNEFGANEVCQIDEIQDVCNPKELYIFPVGEKKKVDPFTAKIAAEMVIELASDRSFCELISIDFCDAFQKRLDPHYVKKGKQLTPESYEVLVKPRLLEIAIKLLQKYLPSLGDLLGHKQHLQHVLAFLSITPVPAETTEFLSQLSEKEREALGVCALAIKEILPESLLKEYGSQYGPDPAKERSHLACSYNAPNDPKRTVKKAYQQVIYSTQQVLYRGIPDEDVKEMLLRWQTSANKEQKSGLLITKTKAYREYKKALGAQYETCKKTFSFFDTPPKQALIDKLANGLNANPNAFKKYMKHFCFPQIVNFSVNISRKSVETLSWNQQKVAYTGSLQPSILPLGMKSYKEEGTDGKIVVSLETKIRKGESAVYPFVENGGPELSKQIEDFLIHNNEFFVFIDSGNWLKSVNLQVWASNVLLRCQKERPDIRGMVIPNVKGEWISLEYHGGKIIELPLEQSLLKPEERLTTIPAKYETGTDIKQKPTAKAIMSVRKGMVLDQVRQSAFRMRQLLQGQSVSFGISDEVKNHAYAQMLHIAFKKSPWIELIQDDALNHETISLIQPKNGIEKQILNAIQKSLSTSSFDWKKLNPLERTIKIIDLFCDENSRIESDVLWRYFAVNSKNEHEWIAGCHRMDAVMTTLILKLLCNKQISFDDRLLIFKEMESFLVSKPENSLFKKMSANIVQVTGAEGHDYQVDRHLAPFEEAFNRLIKANPQLTKPLLNMIHSLYGENDQPINKTQAIMLLKKTLQTCMNPELLSSKTTIGQTEELCDELEIEDEVDLEQEIELEDEREKEIELELEFHVNPNPAEKCAYIPLVNPNVSSKLNIDHLEKTLNYNGGFGLVLAYIQSKDLKKVFFQNDYSIQFSPNLFWNYIGTDKQNQHRLPGEYLLIRHELAKDSVYTLISNQDASETKPHLFNSKTDKISLVSYGNECEVYYPPNDDILKEDENLPRVIVQVKLLNGRLDFTKKELEIIEFDLIGKQEDPIAVAKALKSFFEKLISSMDATMKMYPGSPICMLLKRLASQTRL